MKKYFFLIALPALLLSCSDKKENDSKKVTLKNYFAPADSGLQNGGVKLIAIETPKGKFNVWTKRFGNNPKIKLLLLHGGPGCTHEYFECMESFLPLEGIEFIYYDQLGSGNSDNPGDTSLWDLPRFVEEVEQVRVAWGLNNQNFYLLGHSWGGILAMEYALRYQQNLKGLVISNMMCSAPDYGRYADSVLSKTMEKAVLDTIRMLEAKKDFANPKYMELLIPNFYAQHICRISPDAWPNAVNRTFAHMNQTLYTMMQGPSEFGVSGKLEFWDLKDEIKDISVPTLVIGASHDTMDPEHMKWMSTQVQRGKFLLCPNGSHMCMWDDQQTYMNGLMLFMKETAAAN